MLCSFYRQRRKNEIGRNERTSIEYVNGAEVHGVPAFSNSGLRLPPPYEATYSTPPLAQADPTLINTTLTQTNPALIDPYRGQQPPEYDDIFPL